ncbi:MAG: transglutaminaseTgpA domain-containing protein [Candidatus Omnitrophota bacterium]
MDKNTLYHHFANLGLVLIGFFSAQAILNPFALMIVIVGTIAGFVVSWQMAKRRFQYMDLFVGMLSLAAVVIILGRLTTTAITFENLLKIFSTALIWLALFQSFGLESGKSYAMLQFISVCLLISSAGMALEHETFYIVILALFLLLFIFAMRLNLVCEKKRKGSMIIGDPEEVMSLWQQIKVGALMFSFVLIVAAILYPFVPRFENLSLRWIPSSLLGSPEQNPLLRLLKKAPMTIKDNKKSKQEQLVDDGSKKRETDGNWGESDIQDKLEEKTEETIDTQSVDRFPAKEFNKEINIFKIESLTVKADKDVVPLDNTCRLEAEVKMNDGSSVPVTRFVDWTVTGPPKVTIDRDGNLTPKEKGMIQVSATYMGTFSNDVKIKIVKPIIPISRRGWWYYLLIALFWLLIVALSSATFLIFMKSRRLYELALEDPREFIKELYLVLCRGFKFYGVPRFHYIAFREFFESAAILMAAKPEPMYLMTERVLEARFSTHNISVEHSKKALGLFHEIKEVILEREEPKEIWKKILFAIFLLEILIMPKDFK